MPDSWIDREELASLAGELSRKKRRGPQPGASAWPARKRPRTQGEPGAPPEPVREPASPAEARAPAEDAPAEESAAPARRRELEPVDAPAAESLIEEPVAAEPVAAEPVAAEPVAAEPVAAEPVSAEPVSAEPVAAEPIAAEPVAAEPIAAEPIAAEPVAAEPVIEEPVAAEPVIGEPSTEETGRIATGARSPSAHNERDPAAGGTLTNLTIDEIDIASARSRAPRFLLEAEHLLDELGSSDRDNEAALALRTLANARARVDSGRLLKSPAPDPDPSHAPAPEPAGNGTESLASEPAPDDWGLGSFFELDPDPERGTESPEPFGTESKPESDYEAHFAHAFAAQFEVAFEPEPEPEPEFELDPDFEDRFESAKEVETPGSVASPHIEDATYESTEESLPRKLERLSKSFASSTGARNVCIVDEAGYPLHEENPGLRTQSRSAELAFFPDTRLIGASDLAAAQAFLSGRWHGVIRGASPCAHLFLRFDREDPLETEEMEAWSRHLVEAIH